MPVPKLTLRPSACDAVVFDMDGVLTDTRPLHARAWQETFDEFLAARAAGAAPFDVDEDYARHVDGKPRLAGVRGFLASRGIALDEGAPTDAPGAPTVHGIGNRKNDRFLARLRAGEAYAFDDAVALVRALREAGIATGVISASRNAREVLRQAGAGDLFEVRIDGITAAEAGLAGKPAPDVFVEAARRLGATPARTAIVEDALAGVRAGRRGDFGWVIGVARGGSGDLLAEAGADVVVRSLAEIAVEQDVRRETLIEALPNATDRVAEIAAAIDGREPAFFLDFDGTLSPIVERPEAAALPEETRTLLAALAARRTVAIVSGRDLDDLRERVGLRGVYYAGSHGFRLAAPDGTAWEYEEARRFLPALDEAERRLEETLAPLPGVQLERKSHALAVHFRRAPERAAGEVRAAVEAVRAACGEGLRLGEGRKVLELRPDVPWDKGRAVDWIIDELGLERSRVFPLYVGDDVTDEDAFRAVARDGLGVVVHGRNGRTRARYALDQPADVGPFLARLDAELQGTPGAWSLVYDEYRPEREGVREALCTLGNGYFATRGAAPDAAADGTHHPGTYVAGGYDRARAVVAGREIENEDLVNFPNWLPLSFRVDDEEWFGVDRVQLLAYRQELDLRDGLLRRDLRFRDAAGRTTRWRERRLVSMAAPHLAALSVEIVPEDWQGAIEVRSGLDGTVVNDGVARYRDLADRHLDVLAAERIAPDRLRVHVRTRQSRLEVALAARTRAHRDADQVAAERDTERSGGWVAERLRVEVGPERPVRIEKIAALYTSRDRAISEAALEADRAAERAPGFDELRRAHARAWHRLWSAFDLELTVQEPDAGDPTQRKLRVHAFHLLQTVSPHTIDLDVGVPARGWHGEAYRGHVFWDELFILPMLSLRLPALARALLLYRWRRLPEARRAAREAGCRGAMFPWQSGSNGREESQRLHLNPKSGRWLPDDTHRQRHIGAAIAYNVWRYHETTGDDEFLRRHGAELLIEIARFWASIATYDEADDRWDIRGVMGPDEYQTAYPGAGPDEGGIDDNAYTNVMASWVLERARDALDMLPPERRRELENELALRPEEVERWEEISRKLRLCFHGDGIVSQFAGYDRLEELDWERYRAAHGEMLRLDRILEAEGDTPNRYKASKQADVLMLFYLFSAGELQHLFERLGYPWDADFIPRNIAYYLARTSHGSTLSWVTHAWVLARADRPASWRLFCGALDTDLADVQGGTTQEGIHTGAMAGTVDLIHRCYTGIECRGNTLHFNPSLPREVERIRLGVRYRGQRLAVEVTHDALTVRSGPVGVLPITVAYRDHHRTLSPGGRCAFRLFTPEERRRERHYENGGAPRV